METFQNFDDLRAAVSDSGDVMTVTMGDLRDAYGVDRLGVHVKNGIVKELEGRGLKAFPAELRSYQQESVRIYKAGSTIADIIDAVLNPSEAHDEELKEFTKNNANSLLQKVREIVC